MASAGRALGAVGTPGRLVQPRLQRARRLRPARWGVELVRVLLLAVRQFIDKVLADKAFL